MLPEATTALSKIYEIPLKLDALTLHKVLIEDYRQLSNHIVLNMCFSVENIPRTQKGKPPLKPHPVKNAMEERFSITTTSEHHSWQERGKLLVTYSDATFRQCLLRNLFSSFLHYWQWNALNNIVYTYKKSTKKCLNSSDGSLVPCQSKLVCKAINFFLVHNMHCLTKWMVAWVSCCPIVIVITWEKYHIETGVIYNLTWIFSVYCLLSGPKWRRKKNCKRKKEEWHKKIHAKLHAMLLKKPTLTMVHWNKWSNKNWSTSLGFSMIDF